MRVSWVAAALAAMALLGVAWGASSRVAPRGDGAAAGQPRAEVKWPSEWAVFLPVDRDAPVLPKGTLATLPKVIELAGRTLERKQVSPGDDGTFDFAPLFGGVRPGNTAYAFLEILAEEAGEATLGMGADWWMEAWINGEKFFDTLEEGNVHWPPSVLNYRMDVPLEEGRNVLAVRFVSGSGSSVLALGGRDQIKAAPRPDYSPDANRAHGLEALLERAGTKPWDLYWRDATLMSHRVIFHDESHGTEIWMLDDSPVTEPSETASIWPPWNADGSRLNLRGERYADAGRRTVRRRWVFDADFSRLSLYPTVDEETPGRMVWDLECPDTYYYHRGGRIMKGNLAEGEARVLGAWNPIPGARERLLAEALTKDNRYVFVLTQGDEVGWLPYTPAEGDAFPEGVVRECEERGTVMRVISGWRIHTKTGEVERVVVPSRGQEDYLRAYMSGRVEFPEDAAVPMAEDVDGMFEIYHLYPYTTHGHSAPSPDSEYVADDQGRGVHIFRERDVHRIWGRVPDDIFRRIVISRDGSHYHICWYRAHRFFVTWIRGWRGDLAPPEHANLVAQVFTDGTWQPICDTQHVPNLAYPGGDFSIFSPDATKIHFGSNMAGPFKNFVAVVSRPQPPRGVQWSAQEEGVQLQWQAPPRSREIAGYLVYRSESSGDGYELMTPVPVEVTRWVDGAVVPGRPYYYVITSIEPSGLESRFSAEAARAGVGLPEAMDAPLVVYAEAEDALADLYVTDFPGLAKGVDRRGASDWRYIYRHPDADRGEASLPVSIPASGEYVLWARVRSNEGGPATWRLEIAGVQMEARAETGTWSWVRAGRATLQPGEIVATLSTQDEGAALDLICLSTDEAFAPEGPRPHNLGPPPSPTGLVAENVRDRANRLQWEAAGDPTVSHYNVYASREPFGEVSQRRLIGSPSREELIDWGLRADTRYYYAVTAVDRRGNESAPSTAEAATPAPEAPLQTFELAFAEGERSGDFEIGQAEGTRARRFVLAEAPENEVRWRINVSREAEYYFWPRFLARGRTRRDGPHGSIRPNIRVRLNGEPIASLGERRGLEMAAPDNMLEPGSEIAGLLWTWLRPGRVGLSGVTLPAGEHVLTLENLPENVRYDVLVVTSDPAFRPPDGREMSAR